MGDGDRTRDMEMIEIEMQIEMIEMGMEMINKARRRTCSKTNVRDWF